MKYVFIINPVSGKTNYEKIKENIHKYLKNEEYIIHETKKPLDATKMASKYKNEEDTVVYAVGGDGTLNEVVNGIALGKCKLGIVPTGSGNDFYKTLKKYNKKEGKIDLGSINDRYFINIASVGFDAEVCYEANLIKDKGHFKKIAYILGAIKKMFSFKCLNTDIKLDDDLFSSRITLMAICNGRFYGGGFNIAPLASFDDDHFDVYYAKETNFFSLLALLLKLLRGTHEKSKKVIKKIADNILIKSKKELIINVDGEIIKSKRADIKMIKDAIHIYNDKELVDKIMNLQ